MTAKKIIIIGVVIAVFELVIGIVYLKQSGRKNDLPINLSGLKESTQNLSGESTSAVISLSADKTEVKVSETVLLSVKLTVAGKASTASDLTIKYDPSYLSPALSDPGPFKKGDIFERIVFNAADLKSGVATMSAISSVSGESTSGAFSGEGILATIPFKALKSGQTEVKVVFAPGNTTDSNVVVDAKDVLKNVTNISLQITP